MPKDREPEIIFRGIAKGGKFYPEKPYWWEMNLMNERKIEILVRDEKPPKSLPQLAFFHGILIRICCMNHPDFAGWTFNEIKNDFIQRLTSYPKIIITNEGMKQVTCFDDIAQYDKEKMTHFIERVMQLMVEEHDDMVIPDPHDFQLNKYLKDERI
jgi:hypothetical protein